MYQELHVVDSMSEAAMVAMNFSQNESLSEKEVSLVEKMLVVAGKPSEEILRVASFLKLSEKQYLVELRVY